MLLQLRQSVWVVLTALGFSATVAIVVELRAPTAARARQQRAPLERRGRLRAARQRGPRSVTVQSRAGGIGAALGLSLQPPVTHPEVCAA
jgi:hypothetical protein